MKNKRTPLKSTLKRAFQRDTPFGVDALRLAFALEGKRWRDVRFTLEKVETCRHFLHKLHNAARFVGMKTDGLTLDKQARVEDFRPLSALHRWIFGRIDKVHKEIVAHLVDYHLTKPA